MAIFTITTREDINRPPNVLGVYSLEIDSQNLEYTFLIENLTDESTPPYSDPEGDPLESIKIVSIYSNNTGTFTLNGLPIEEDQVITNTDINNGLFKYEGVLKDNAYIDIIDYIASDTGSSQFSIVKGSIVVTVETTKNLPPTVGDVEKEINYGEALVFTTEMFINDAEPPYYDPEGDAPERLRIDSLPSTGLLIFDSEDVYAGQIINFSDIDEGKLMYLPDTDIKEEVIIEFAFSVSDSGSGEFSD